MRSKLYLEPFDLSQSGLSDIVNMFGKDIFTPKEVNFLGDVEKWEKRGKERRRNALEEEMSRMDVSTSTPEQILNKAASEYLQGGFPEQAVNILQNVENARAQREYRLRERPQLKTVDGDVWMVDPSTGEKQLLIPGKEKGGKEYPLDTLFNDRGKSVNITSRGEEIKARNAGFIYDKDPRPEFERALEGEDKEEEISQTKPNKSYFQQVIESATGLLSPKKPTESGTVEIVGSVRRRRAR